MACDCEQPRVAAATEPFDAQFPVPAYPPHTWFTEKPDWLTPDTKIAVSDDGRVAGYFYHSGQCLVHDPSACPKPSPTRYAAFHQQEVVTDDGLSVRVGVIGNVNGHADPYARVDVAAAHYADPDKQLISCCAYDDEHGGYILGAMVPHASYGDVALVRRSALSGDWRPMPDAWWRAHGVQASVVRSAEGYDCIGPTLVTRPGLPLVRSYPRAASLGGLGGIQLEDSMESTTIELPDGTKITRPTAPAAPGPHPVPAVAAAVAAPPASPPAVTAAEVVPGGGESDGAESESESEDESGVEQRVADLEAAVGELQNVVGQLIDMVSEPMAAAAALPE